MIEMDKRLVLFFLLLITLPTVQLEVSIAAEPRIVGVHIGDYFKYEIKVIAFSSDDPNVTSTSQLISFPTQNLTFFEIHIIDIQETNVTFQCIYRWENGTEYGNASVYVDIRTGAGFRLIIASNLDVNDTIYEIPIGDPEWNWRINDTIPTDYLGSIRDTNHLNVTTHFSYMENGSTYQMTDFIDRYWDKETGIIVKDNPIMQIKRDNYTTTGHWQWLIIESNVWIVPEFPSFPILPLLMMATLLVVIVYKRKHQTLSISNDNGL
jgi:hypothetical protein